MALRVTYKYKKEPREINFTYDRHHDIHEAIAAAEGVDLTRFHIMEQQVAMTSKGSAAVRDFRDKEFKRMGFSDIYYIKDIPNKEMPNPEK